MRGDLPGNPDELVPSRVAGSRGTSLVQFIFGTEFSVLWRRERVGSLAEIQRGS
jgi:hypothetical protein